MAFVDAGEVDRTSLRQGDIINDVHLVGAICYRDVFAPASVVAETTMKQWTVSAKLENGPVVVLSHCCEIAKENGVKLTSIILAPLRDVSTAAHPDKVAELIESNELKENGPAFSYLKYFYLPSSSALNFPRGCVADFSKLFSIRKSSYEFLLGKKILQMTDAAREALALKLAVYFYREDETEAA